MEKNKPHCPLQRVKELISEGRFNMTKTATASAAALDFTEEAVMQELLALNRGEFYKSMTTYNNRGCQLNNDAISFQLPLTWNLAKSAIVRSTISRVLDTTIDFLLKRANQCLCLPLFCSRYTVCDLL